METSYSYIYWSHEGVETQWRAAVCLAQPSNQCTRVCGGTSSWQDIKHIHEELSSCIATRHVQCTSNASSSLSAIPKRLRGLPTLCCAVPTAVLGYTSHHIPRTYFRMWTMRHPYIAVDAGLLSWCEMRHGMWIDAADHALGSCGVTCLSPAQCHNRSVINITHSLKCAENAAYIAMKNAQNLYQPPLISL